MVGPFKPARGNMTDMLVMVDKFTKWIEVKPIRKLDGKTASAPYTMKNGVYPVERFGVVLKPHKTCVISSIQQPGVFFNGSSNRALMPANTKAFDLSTWPLA